MLNRGLGITLDIQGTTTAVSIPNQILDFDEGKSNLSKEHLKSEFAS